MGKKKKQAINIQFIFPEGREVKKTKEQMTQALRDSYLRAITKGKKRLTENNKKNE